jgi:putative oxidoreductase
MEFFRRINNGVAGIVANSALNHVLILAARLLLGGMFLVAGYSKIGSYAGTQGYMEAMGVPGIVLPLVILLEIGGGLALILGFQTRLAAVALAVFTVIAGLLFHGGADPMQQIMFMKNLAIAGGLLAFTVFGAGRASLDAETAT